MKTIRRYLIKEIIQTWVAVTAVLLLIVVSNRLVRYLSDAAAGALPGDAIFQILGLKLIGYFALLAPFSLYLGILLSFGRLCRDSEMAALFATGVGIWDLYRALFRYLTPLFIGLLWLVFYGSPWAAQEAFRVQSEAEHAADFKMLRAGRFQESRSGDRVFLIDQISKDKTAMENIFIETRDNEVMSHTSAQRALQEFDEVTGERFLVLEDGYRYQGIPGASEYQVIRFKRQSIRANEPGAIELGSKQEGVPTAQLFASAQAKDRAELQWRISVPIMALLLVLLAVPLSQSRPREGRYARLVIGVLLYTVYANMQLVAKAWVEQAKVPVFVGMWWVHLALFIGIVWIWYRDGHFRTPIDRSVTHGS